MQRLVWLATSTRPNEDPSKPFTPQCSSWKHFIASRYTEFTDPGTNFQEILAFAVPNNSTWIICHVGVQVAHPAISDPGLGETPFNYGDFRSNYSLNGYGDYGVVGGGYPQLHWRDQQGDSLTPGVPSAAMQAQQVLIVIPAGTTGRLMANFAAQKASDSFKCFAFVWGWLVPPQVGGRLQDFSTTWFVQA